LKIIKLIANNIKKLKAIEITPKGDMVVITGKNGQGKTNVLEAIWYALAGSKDIPTEPIRKGEDEGDIELDLGEYVVTRKFTKGGENTYLEVRNKDGARFPSPQSLLDKLIGDVSFNPIDLMKASNRDEMLLDIAGLSGKLEEIDRERQEKYSQRTFENREVKKFEVQIKKGLTETKPVNVQELVKEIRDVEGFYDCLESHKDSIKEYEEDIKDLEAKLNQKKKELSDCKEELDHMEKKQKDVPQLDELQDKLQKAEEINQQARDYEANEKIKSEHKKRKQTADKLTKDIEELDKYKKDLIKKAKFPVPGMGYREGKVTLNDVPLNQLSKSEEVLLGIRIQMELHPELKVILIPDASLLDTDSMKELEKLAKDKDYQCWIERVEDENIGILIEDGTVKADNQ
jgi:DNA repair exonuclease SbcCD ATPase subunit